jgi:ABC-type sugar transport system substrate-binding protein
MAYSSISWGNPTNKIPVNHKPKVTFFVQADPGFHFWDSEVLFATAMAETHQFDLDVVHTPRIYRNRFNVVNFVEGYLDSLPTYPDLVVTSFWLGSEHKMLSMLDKKQIPSITINSNISVEQLSMLGQPREKFPLWLGHISPDDVNVGEQLGLLLIEQVKKEKKCLSKKCKVDLFAITGLNYSAVSLQRIAGLKKAVESDRWSALLNVVYGNWKREAVASMMNTITTRHPHIDAYWVASDIMAYGIQDGLEEINKALPVDTLVGSIDWSPPTVNEIRKGHIDFSLGGHFMEAGWALMLYADYLAGFDFADSLGTVINVPMSLLSKDNVDTLGAFLSTPKWTSDNLSLYSKALNSDLKVRSLSPADIINNQISFNEASVIDKQPKP